MCAYKIKKCIFCCFISLIVATAWTHSAHATTDTSALDIAIAGDCFFVVLPSGNLVGWGNNAYKLIPGTAASDVLFSDRLILLSRAVHITTGGFCALAIDADNILYGWGTNSFGQLLAGPMDAGKIVLMENVISAAAGSSHCTTVTSDGALSVWGRNNFGQLGFAFSDDAPVLPQKLLDGMKSTYVFGDVSFAISQSDDLYT